MTDPLQPPDLSVEDTAPGYDPNTSTSLLRGFSPDPLISDAPTPINNLADAAAPVLASSSGDAPLFEMCYVDPTDGDTGPLSTPNAEDYPIGAHVRLHDEERCQRAMGDAWLPWMPALCGDGVTVRVLRHLTDHTLVDLQLCPSAWGMPAAPAGEDTLQCSQRADDAPGHTPQRGRIYTRVTLARACLVGPRLSNADRDRYSTPPKTSATDSPQAHGGALPSSSGRFEAVGSLDSVFGRGAATYAPNALSTTLPPGVSLSTIKAARERGNKFYKDRQTEAAVAAYSEALEMIEQNAELVGSREHVRSLSCRSAVFMQLRKHDEALVDARRIIEVAPSSVDGYVRAGHVMRRKRDHRAADMYYGQALTIAPDEEGVKKQRDANSLAAVLTQSLPATIDMVVDPSQISVITKKRVERGARVFTEAPVASVPATDEAAGAASCGHCHSVRVDRDAMLSHISVSDAATSRCKSILAGIVGPTFSGAAVACGHQCGTQYCSERCRAAAWEEYHWAECSANGTWARATSELSRVIAPATTNAKVLMPHLVWLTYRMVAIFVRRNGASFTPDAFRFNFSCRCSALASELSAVQVDVAERVYDVLQRGWPEDLSRQIPKALFLEALEFVMNSALFFGVTPAVKLEDAVVSHLGLLQDRCAFGNDDAAKRHVKALEELRSALPQVAFRLQTRCIGAFRVIGSCRRSEDPRFTSFADTLENSTFVPRPFSPSPVPVTLSPGGLTSNDARAAAPASSLGAQRRQSGSTARTANATVTAMSPSAMVGLGVVALCDLTAYASLILDVPHAISARSTPSGSMASRGTTTTFSSVGSHQSIANMVPATGSHHAAQPSA